jgi:hypothetical protein
VLTITMEDAMKEKEPTDILSNAGFTAAEIARLQQLRRKYMADTSSHLSATHRRHEFSNWLEAAVHRIFGESYPEWTRYH